MGLKNKSRGKDQMCEVPMSSMIDVVFLLLIYFIITHKEEINEAHLAVNLPSPNPAPQINQTPPRVIQLEIHPNQILLQGVPRTLAEVTDTLTYLGELDPEQTVMIKTSVMARTRELVSVLDVCRRVGLTQLNLMTLK